MDTEQHNQQNKKQRNRKTNKVILSVIGGVVLVIIIFAVVGNALSKKTPNNQGSDTPQYSTPAAKGGSASSTPSTTTPSKSGSSTTPSSCWTAAQSWNEEGQTGCVTFTGYADTSDSGQMYLNQDSSDYADGFSVWIPAGESFGQSTLNQYSGQQISVTGTITKYDGAPEIEVTQASQIQAAN